MGSRSLILILGAPRSGTTLLAAIVGGHSEIGMLHEDFSGAAVNVVGKRYAGNKLCIPNQIERSEKSTSRSRLATRAMGRLGIKYDKRPRSMLSIDDYLKHDGLKLIAIMRSPSAVVSSIMKRGKKDIKMASYRWSRSIDIIAELQRDVGDKLLICSFDQLVSAPEELARGICIHLNLEFEPRMLEGFRYMPLYSNKAIDPAKSTSTLDEGLERKVAESHPDSFATYQRLLQDVEERVAGEATAN